MKAYTAVVERCPDTGLYVGHVPGFPGAHSQGETLDELNENLREVITMLLEDGEPELEAEFVGTHKSLKLMGELCHRLPMAPVMATSTDHYADQRSKWTRSFLYLSCRGGCSAG